MLTPTWLPPAFTLAAPSAPSLPATASTLTATGPTSESLEIHFSYSATPLNGFDGGATVIGATEVDGQPGIVEGPPPGPPGQFVDVFWKPSPSDLLSVRGEGLPESTIVEVAQHLHFSPPKVVDLPLVAPEVVSEATAIRRAEHAAHGSRGTQESHGRLLAKLTSWSEVTAMLQDVDDVYQASIPAAVADTPWAPVWAVLVGRTTTATRTGGLSMTKRRKRADLVLVDAASGTILATVHLGRVASTDLAWFTAITNRAAQTGTCTRATGPEVPFGVLTRAEQAFRARHMAWLFRVPTSNGIARITSKLTTVVALNQATPSALGCIEVDCSIPALLWTTIMVVRARRPGKTVACRLTDPIVGTGVTRVVSYTRFQIPTSGELECGPEPAWMTNLRSLVPAVSLSFTAPPHIGGR